jgi:serine protease Do
MHPTAGRQDVGAGRANTHTMRITTAGVALLTVLAVAACGGSASTTTIKNASGSGRANASGSSAATTTVTHTATATGSGAGDGASSSTQSGSGGVGLPTNSSGGAPPCKASGLTLSFLGQQGATGHGELGFALRNTGNASCSTLGYPGVQFLDRGGAPLPTTPTHTTSDFFGHTGLHALTVGPGQTVSFRLGVTHGAGSSAGCTTADALQVIAPNDTATLKTAIPGGAAECATATVSPLQAGDSAYP